MFKMFYETIMLIIALAMLTLAYLTYQESKEGQKQTYVTPVEATINTL